MKLHHFYHVYADGQWMEPVSQHLRALKEKGQVYQHEKFGWQHIKFKNVQPNLEEKYD